MLEFGDVTMTSLAVTAWEVGGKVLPLCGILVKPRGTHGNTIILPCFLHFLLISSTKSNQPRFNWHVRRLMGAAAAELE